MATVADILKNRGPRELAHKPPEATVRDALELMAERGIGSVLVMHDGTLDGIFTERDYARKVILKGLHSVDTRLGDVMTGRLYVVGPQQTVQECMGIMTEARVRHLPVADGGKVIALVSIGDLVNAMLQEQQFLISQLENYIGGGLG